MGLRLAPLEAGEMVGSEQYELIKLGGTAWKTLAPMGGGFCIGGG